jgi:hypothetical protein
VEHIVRFVDAAPEYCCVVSVVYEVPFHENAPISLDPSTD